MRITYNASLRRKMITSVSATVMAALTATATAQEAAEVTDEVVVTGIRQALESSLDVKRNAKGIVDSISAEDMGKFPDSNLAESLQRVTGVAIDRDLGSGQGKTVTVRGFGADFNLVTLNGRTMPTSTLGDFASAPSTRSFDFGNLAPEAVSAVDIYKTSRASQASGGMGSTINIRTTRPLDAPGFKATVGVKGVDDKSSDESLESETSFLISNTFMNDTIGVALTSINSSLSHTNASFRHQWSPFEKFSSASLAAIDEASDTVNGVSATSGNTGIGADTLIANINGATGYYINDLEQERTNFQLTAQYRPLDNVTITYDNTIAELEHMVRSRDLTFYVQEGTGNSRTSTSVYGTGSNPATIESLTYDHADIFGHNSSMGLQKNKTEVEAHGLNVEWDVDEKLSLAFDFSSASSDSLPDSPYGSNAYITTTAKVPLGIAIDYTSDLPAISITGDHADLGSLYAQGYHDNDGVNYENGRCYGIDYYNCHRWLGGADNVFAFNTSDLDQFQVNGSYDMAGSKFEEYADVVDFGASYWASEIKTGFYQQPTGNDDGIQPPAWNRWPNYGIYFDKVDGQDRYYYQQNLESLQPYFSDLNGSANMPEQILNIAYEDLFSRYQVYGALADNDALTDICRDNTLENCSNFTYTTQRTLEEKTFAAYAQATKDFTFYDFPASIVAGLRFENTEVTSKNYLPTYSGTVISGNDSVKAQAADSLFVKTEGDYSYLLPSVDFDVDVRDDVKLRASYSQSIARQTYDKLAGGTSINVTIQNAKTGPAEYQGTGNEGDPNLEPFESENIDLSAEWYYGDISYASIGYFMKRTSNWVSTGNRYGSVQDLRHAAWTNDALNGAANGTASTSANDLVTFNISVNEASSRNETVDGIELAVQHDFADYNPIPYVDLTGFGIIANMTLVDSDASYNNTLANSENDGQFAIIGISDSHNLIAYYDRFGLSARVAYNWRDRFLNFQGASSGYTEEYEQVDANISYTVPGTGLTVFYDGINLTEEGRETFERNNPSYKTWVSQGHAKHYLGVRYTY